MSWYFLHELPPMVVADLKAQQNPGAPGENCGCGCLLSKDSTEVWFCAYHSGFYDAVVEMEDER